MHTMPCNEFVFRDISIYLCFSPAQSAFGKLVKVLMAAFILRELFVRLRIIMCVIVAVDMVVDDLEKKTKKIGKNLALNSAV